jgi:hypothetical protein
MLTGSQQQQQLSFFLMTTIFSEFATNEQENKLYT